ncbi:hypothetical protein NKI09_07120 [Mesorhizobium sp. M0757]|uniref:hypothetical protein n=1 Tax=Mesorhizobium sp. M0757 TaxID=2956993 RepID=UPI0033358EED
MEQKLKKHIDRAGRDGYSINEFCVRFAMSTATYFKMRAAGQGPREMRINGSFVRITEDAITDWKHERENDADADAHRAANKQRSQFAVSGGRT